MKTGTSLWIGVAVTVGWLGYSSADTAATRRLSPTSQAIETIAVGTHVLAENPTDEADHEFGVCVESEDWRKLTLLAQKADGTTADVVLLRPLWWLEAQRAQVGGQVELHAPECGIEGHARVLAIDACPPVTRPPPGYRTVTGTFRHHAAQICRVRAEQLDTTIACTPNHPFWSEDLQQFVRADELRPGETLRACDRTYQVASVEHSDQPETGFNLEVQVDHTYFVTSTGILVHNTKGDNCKLLARRVRSVDELLVNGTVPANRGGAFNRWFDNLTPDELDALWRSDRQIGSSSIRELIEDRIRSPGGLHEWLMAGRANKFKRWGVGMDTIKDLRTVITDRALKLKRPSDLPSHIAPLVPRGYHGGPLSGRFHYELRALIDASRNYRDFTLRMRRFAKRWLPNGIQDLPPGLIQ